MIQLKFTNPVFNEGLNVTVRRGTKWSGASGIVEIAPSQTANIEYTRTMRFEDILPADIEHEHDPTCRDYIGLWNEMFRLYPAFEDKEIVTLIYFTPLRNSEQGAQESDTSKAK